MTLANLSSPSLTGAELSDLLLDLGDGTVPRAHAGLHDFLLGLKGLQHHRII